MNHDTSTWIMPHPHGAFCLPISPECTLTDVHSDPYVHRQMNYSYENTHYRVAKTRKWPWITIFFAKEPWIIGLFCRKWPIKIKHAMDVCLSVHLTLLYSHATSFAMSCMSGRSCLYLCICTYIDRWTTRVNTHTTSNPLVFARYMTPMNVS